MLLQTTFKTISSELVGEATIVVKNTESESIVSMTENRCKPIKLIKIREIEKIMKTLDNKKENLSLSQLIKI